MRSKDVSKELVRLFTARLTYAQPKRQRDTEELVLQEDSMGGTPLNASHRAASGWNMVRWQSANHYMDILGNALPAFLWLLTNSSWIYVRHSARALQT